MNLRGCLCRSILLPATGMRRWLLLPLVGPRGVRAPVRALLYIVLLALAVTLLALAVHAVTMALPAHTQHALQVARAQARAGIVTPGRALVQEAGLLACVLVATAVMSWLDGSRFAAIGLPPRHGLRDLLGGFVVGFVWIALLVGALLAFGAARLLPPGSRMTTELGWGITWLIAMLLVGAFEELAFRGYLLAMLRSRYGFWPAALVVSALFALAHAHNGGEQLLGLATVVVVSIFLCLAIRRSGALWWVIGWHAAWDWGETFIFGASDRGNPAHDRLMTLQPHGGALLSGGTVGPEGSILCFAVLILAILTLPWLVPSSGLGEVGATSGMAQRQP